MVAIPFFLPDSQEACLICLRNWYIHTFPVHLKLCNLSLPPTLHLPPSLHYVPNDGELGCSSTDTSPNHLNSSSSKRRQTGGEKLKRNMMVLLRHRDRRDHGIDTARMFPLSSRKRIYSWYKQDNSSREGELVRNRRGVNSDNGKDMLEWW